MRIEQVEYRVNWKKFRPGTSIFLPCLDRDAARKVVLAETNRHKIKVFMRGVIEEGIQGLRVWRLS